MEVNKAYVRPLKARDLQNRYERLVQKEELRVEEVPGGLILPLRRFAEDTLLFGRGGVINSAGEFCEVSGIAGRVWGGYRVDDEIEVDEEVIYGGYLVRHWGHFLIEGVARLWHALERPNLKLVFMVEAGNEEDVRGNFREFLECLGVWERTVIINRPHRYRSVWVPELAYEGIVRWHLRMRDAFERIRSRVLGDSEQGVGAGKVFLSRSQFKKAHESEIGLDMLDDLMERNGYRICYPEKLSLRELVQLLGRAGEIAVESGSVAHNILFARAGMKVTIVERQAVVNPIQNALDRISGCEVTYVDGHYALYPVDQGGGPFWLAYNQWLKKWVADRGYCEPSERYRGEAYRREGFRKWLKTYHSWHYLRCAAEPWYIQYADTLLEAYWDTEKEIGEYLRGSRWYCWRQVCEWRQVKVLAHQVLGWLRRR